MNLSTQHKKEPSVVKDMQTEKQTGESAPNSVIKLDEPKLKMCKQSVQLPAEKDQQRSSRKAF